MLESIAQVSTENCFQHRSIVSIVHDENLDDTLFPLQWIVDFCVAIPLQSLLLDVRLSHIQLDGF